jgi:hypothetical protein
VSKNQPQAYVSEGGLAETVNAFARVAFEALRALATGGGNRAIGMWDNTPNDVRDYHRSLVTYTLNRPFDGPDQLYTKVLEDFRERPTSYNRAADPLLYEMGVALEAGTPWSALAEPLRRRFLLFRGVLMGLWTPTIAGEDQVDVGETVTDGTDRMATDHEGDVP